MAINISVGGESFEELRQAGLYYVDKTELLYELAGEAHNKVTLFTRPRRFGKTLNVSMMESFFDIARDSRAVFEGLAVMRHPDFCADWMNQYPVLSISFKDVDGLDFDGAYIALQGVISDLCFRYSQLLENENVHPFDKATFKLLKEKRVGPSDLRDALKTIMRMLHSAYGKPVILLMDEYDVPLAKASEKNTAQNGYYARMLDLIRGIMSISLKTNEYLKFAVITGCLRMTEESIFTGTNNFMSYSVLDDRFAGYFGFTQREVDELLAAAGLSDRRDVFRSWYDGYVFGKTSVYCPWDVVSYASALLYDRGAEPLNYWRNTSGNGVIKEFIGRYRVARKFETLMNGGSISVNVSDQLTYDLLRESEDNLWSALLMTGYLTKADANTGGATVELRIPNAEIAGIFQDTVAARFRETLDTGRQEALMDALWSGDAETASRLMSELLRRTISYNDYREDYYHAFLAGVFVGRGYETESNKERGTGRPDLQLFDEDNDRAMILEIKKADSRDSMDKSCDAALRQITQRGYAADLEDEFGKVMCYGVAFYQKTALIKPL